MTTRRLLKRAAAAPASLLSSSRGFFRVTWASHRRQHRNTLPRTPHIAGRPAGLQGDSTCSRHPNRSRSSCSHPATQSGEPCLTESNKKACWHAAALARGAGGVWV